MSRRECSGCGRMSCRGECFLESPADYPDDEFELWLAKIAAEEAALKRDPESGWPKDKAA